MDILVQSTDFNGFIKLYLIDGFDSSLTNHSTPAFKIHELSFAFTNDPPTWYQTQDWYTILRMNSSKEFMKAG